MRKGKKIVLELSLVSFLNDVSSEILSAILPLFLTSLGASGIAIGFVGGMRKGISKAFQLPFGYLSDKCGRRKIFVLCGYAVSAFFKFALFLSRTLPLAATCALLERVGKGVRTSPRDAMIGDVLTKSRGEGFGIHRTFDTLGAILGAVLAFLLVTELKWDFYSVILFSACIALFALLPFKFIPEITLRRKPKSFFASLKELSPRFLRFMLVSQIFFLGFLSYMFLLLRVNELFGTAPTLAFYIVFNVFYAIFAIPFGRLSDAIGRKRVLSAGYLLFSLVALGFAFAQSLLAFFALFALYGVCYAIVESNQKAFVSDLETLRGTAMGVYNTVSGISLVVGGTLAGILWDISHFYAFLYAFFLAFISALAIHKV